MAFNRNNPQESLANKLYRLSQADRLREINRIHAGMYGRQILVTTRSILSTYHIDAIVEISRAKETLSAINASCNAKPSLRTKYGEQINLGIRQINLVQQKADQLNQAVNDIHSVIGRPNPGNRVKQPRQLRQR